MNGLKYIRTRCNYSQRTLAEALGVSRQAVNMWENSKKIMSEQHREAVCALLGIDNPELLNELSPDMHEKISNMPIFKLPCEENSERFSLSPIGPNSRGISFLNSQLASVSLDEELALKRLELKTLCDGISNFTIESKAKNSYNNLHLLNIALKIFGDTFDLCKEARTKLPEYVMVYIRTIFAILDAMSISFGLVEKNDILNKEVSTINLKLYDYRDFSVKISDLITKHLDDICNDIPTKRENPHANHRRRTKKTS